MLQTTGVVERHPEGSSGRASPPPSVEEPAPPTQDGAVPQGPGIVEPSRMAVGKRALMDRGFSEEVANRVCAPQADSTRAVYEGKWRIFKKYCEDKDIDPFKASPPQIGDFLTYLFDKKDMMPSTIEGYRTAIAGALKHQTGINLGKDPILTDLLSWMHRRRPKSSKVIPPWDLKLVLLALQEPPFEPLQDANAVSLQHLTWKTVFLTLLASGGRRGEVHALEYKSFQHHPKWKYVILRPHPEFVNKTQIRTQGATKLDSFKIPSLYDFVGPDLPKDQKLCPVRALKAYRARTQNMREGKHLFISHRPEHKGDIHRNTVSGWIRKLLTYIYKNAKDDTLRLAGTSTHAIRGMAATLAYRGGVDLEEVLRACSWSSQTTFTDFYLKDVSVVQDNLSALGPLAVAQSVTK